MHKQQSFPLRIGAQDRARAKRLAQRMGLSENRLYADLIQEGLLIREQMAYFEKLRRMHVTPKQGLSLLDLAPDTKPESLDAIGKSPRKSPASR